ncbi:hypothetical protein BG011_002496 [Mortierella polycephala]|uniref:Protein-S-isoprenylcysteine O-methyltransferase n=1 Tax=Mortierella polycephala TaxID=41804 RepID=A0A9P6Q362_9FUNG|nr:hypothetical protein BG011_002496 [Mortierella polycephala]
MTILAKSACLALSAWSFFMAAKSPKSSRTVDRTKEDKVLDENWLKNVGVLRFPFIVSSVGVFEAGAYIFMISRTGASLLGTNTALQQMSVLKPWQIGATAVCFAGYLGRKWCYLALDHFFTFELTIRSEHKLIGHGPYRFLRHPSYTASIVNGISFYALVWHEGLYEVLASYLGRALSWALESNIVVPNTILGIPGGLWVTALYTYFITSIFVFRVPKEEEMLSRHFGKEWDLYAAKRWRLIPFIY